MDRSALLTLLATRIMAISLPHPLRVALDGVDAAGKTTLADELAGHISPYRPVIRAGIDRFHHPREFRYRRGPDSPEGYYHDSFDLAALRRLLLDPLGPGGTREIQTSLFDFRADAPHPAAPVQAPVDAILLFDGVFLQRPELAGGWDFVIFVEVSFETVLARAVERDRDLFGSPQAVIERYNQRYIPAQRLYLAECRPAQHADVVVINDNPSSPITVINDDRHQRQPK
jgi:uridine kinase